VTGKPTVIAVKSLNLGSASPSQDISVVTARFTFLRPAARRLKIWSGPLATSGGLPGAPNSPCCCSCPPPMGEPRLMPVYQYWVRYKKASSYRWAAREASDVSQRDGMARHINCGELNQWYAGFQASTAR